ncbi:hypothetical protein M569_11518 [Genlisea aurea]|uniref:Uncharacterized protein n=1 Tax=Genlisea aurea TaxID=192259 RepID=S8DTX3_9LAMI|nr:hypothetical protein M569_11518 [Genlisea aurea]
MAAIEWADAGGGPGAEERIAALGPSNSGGRDARRWRRRPPIKPNKYARITRMACTPSTYPPCLMLFSPYECHSQVLSRKSAIQCRSGRSISEKLTLEAEL